MLSDRAEDAFTGAIAHGAATLPLSAQGMSQAQSHPPSKTRDSYSPSYYQDPYAEDQSRCFSADFQSPDPEADLNSKPVTEVGPAVTVPTDMQKNNQEQIVALVNSREREVSELQTTLAVPIAHFNAKFLWHCIMNIERDCEYVFIFFFPLNCSLSSVSASRVPHRDALMGDHTCARSRTRGRIIQAARFSQHRLTALCCDYHMCGCCVMVRLTPFN